MTVWHFLFLFSFFFFGRYSPNFGLGLPPWNSPFHFGLLDLRHSLGLLGRVISSSQGLYLYTNTEKRTYTHKHQTSMPWVGFEPTIPASERAKTVHAGSVTYYFQFCPSSDWLNTTTFRKQDTSGNLFCFLAIQTVVEVWLNRGFLQSR
jgi:hypothetical protein